MHQQSVDQCAEGWCSNELAALVTARAMPLRSVVKQQD